MRVVLRSDIEKLGKRGDVVEVADGFARNYLIPRGQALLATKGITSQAAAMRTARDRADVKKREEAESVARTLVGTTVRIPARVGAEGKLFGSVTNQEIADALEKQSRVSVDRRQFGLHEPIKAAGTHEVPVKLHTDVQVTLKVEVVSDDK